MVRHWYRPDLDGLRAIAILLVIVDHAGVPTTASAAGVTAFFVLSGYLITGILLREERIDLRAFYVRRARRLAPAMIVVLAFCTAAGLLGAWSAGWPGQVAQSTFYVTNWPLALGSSPNGPMDHAWSLAIEEQFYLSWPLLLFLSRRAAVPIALSGIAIALIVRAGSGEVFGYYSTIGRMDALLLGCLAAIAGQRTPAAVGWIGLALLGVAAAAPVAIRDQTTLAEVAAVLIVTSRTPLGWLAPLGRRAYSLYLWNWPLTLLAGPLAPPLTFAVAELSYRFVERPFLHPHPGSAEAQRRSSADQRPIRPVVV